MNAADLYHPSVEELAAFASGVAQESAAAEISGHLAACAACQTVIDSLPDDTLLSMLRRATPATDPGSEAPSQVPAPLEATCAPAVGDAVAELPHDLLAHPRYHILEVLGSGGMGAVYKAEHRLMERIVALKVINPNLMSRPAIVERFRREVKAAARLSHPNIVRAYDADQVGDAHFLIMEYVDGISLAELVKTRGPLPATLACDYIQQAAAGLQFACEHGMVHRDIKPHNLMLTQRPNGDSTPAKNATIKILDFGLARLAREESAGGAPESNQFQSERDDSGSQAGPVTQIGPLTEVGALMGTADFVAPEQAADPRHADIRADVYSLGCTLYYLLAGVVPFPDGSVSDKLTAHREQKPVPLAKHCRDIPSKLAAVIDRMIAKDPGQRFQTPREVADALRPFTSEGAKSRRNARRLALAGVSSIAAALLAAVIYVQTDVGEFVIEADSDKVAVMLSDKGLKVRDEAANREYLLKIGRHRVRSGDYQIDVQELPDGIEFSTKAFTIKRGKSAVVKITFNVKKDPGYLKHEALSWFPADATLFYAQNLEIFPRMTRLSLLVMLENLNTERDRFSRFMNLVGDLERISLADCANRKTPDQARIFVRCTGSIKTNRVLDFFRQECPGAVIEESESMGKKVFVIHDPQSPTGLLGGAFALVGTTDMVYAAHGRAKPDVEAIRECLAIREGKVVRLPDARSEDLKEVPANAWVFACGEPPVQIRKHWTDLFFKARSSLFSMSGTHDVEIRYRGAFESDLQAKLFVASVNLVKQASLNAGFVKADKELSLAVSKAFESMQLEAKANQVSGSMMLPNLVWNAFLEMSEDTPLKRVDGASSPVSQGDKPAPANLKDEALRWFPGEATYFSAGDTQLYPELWQTYLLLWADGDGLGQRWANERGDRFRKFLDLIGRTDRVAIAYVENQKTPDDSRYFIRLTGSFKTNRLVDFFRREWTGLAVDQAESQGELVTVIHDAEPTSRLGTSLTLVGTSELLLAGYFKSGRRHVEVGREALELRAGRGQSVPLAQAKALEDIPQDAWVLGIGEPPAGLKKMNFPALLMPVRSVVGYVTGASDLEIKLRLTFATDADAKTFATVLNLLKAAMISAPAVLKDAKLLAAVEQAFESLKVDDAGNGLRVSIQIPAVAASALMKKIEDMPVREWTAPPASTPVMVKDEATENHVALDVVRRELASLRLELPAAKSSAEQLAVDRARSEKLREKHAISQEEFDSTQEAADEAQAKIAEIERAIAVKEAVLRYGTFYHTEVARTEQKLLEQRVASARAKAKHRRTAHERIEKLYEVKAAAKSEVDRAERELRAAEEVLQLLEAELQPKPTGPPH